MTCPGSDSTDVAQCPKEKATMNIRPQFALAFATIGFLSSVGCQSSQISNPGSPEKAVSHAETKAIDLVKNGILKIDKDDGTFKSYDSTTVGKAFDGTFQDGKWTSFETDKGATVVEFNGTIKQAVLRGAGFHPIDRRSDVSSPEEDNLVIKFQFKVSVDQTRFELSAMDWNPWITLGSTGMVHDEDAVLSFIYH
jgi:hypothetical protein